MTKYELPWNPWRVLDLQRSRAGDPYAYPYERRVIMNAYRHCAEPEPCECGGRRFWRDTVGVLMCPDCRRMRVHGPDGDKIIVGSGYTPEWSA